jgi:hydrogenase nickel incorporation protein HypA/HybF
VHEVSIMQDALELAETQARARGASRIHRITLRIGALSGVVPDALEFAFDAVSSGTMADGAELRIERVSALAFCTACSREYEPDEYISQCPHCAAFGGEIRRGREMYLAGLEVS